MAASDKADARKLRLICDERRMKVSTLSALTGINRHRTGRLVRGDAVFRPEEKGKLAQALQVPEAAIFEPFSQCSDRERRAQKLRLLVNDPQGMTLLLDWLFLSERITAKLDL